jgi:hypothetical protein
MVRLLCALLCVVMCLVSFMVYDRAVPVPYAKARSRSSLKPFLAGTCNGFKVQSDHLFGRYDTTIAMHISLSNIAAVVAMIATVPVSIIQYYEYYIDIL